MRLVLKRGGGWWGFYALGWRTSQAGRGGILLGCTCCISAPLPLCCTQCHGQTTCNWGTAHTYLTRLPTIIIIVTITSLSSSSISSSSVWSNRISLNNVLWLLFQLFIIAITFIPANQPCGHFFGVWILVDYVFPTFHLFAVDTWHAQDVLEMAIFHQISSC